MIIWERFSFRYRMLCVILVIYIVLYFIFRFLIKSNKIKPNKLTRLFYEDDEQFIKKWEKDREKGKFINIITAISKIFLFYILTFSLLVGGDVSAIKDTWSGLLGTLLGFIIGAPFGWCIKEDKY